MKERPDVELFGPLLQVIRVDDFDQAIAEARAQGVALGLSSHSLWELARARTLSPRYIACGPVHPTTTKDMPWAPQGTHNLSYWCATLDVSVVRDGSAFKP